MNLHFVIFQVYILLYYFGDRELNFIIKIITVYEEKFDFFYKNIKITILENNKYIKMKTIYMDK